MYVCIYHINKCMYVCTVCMYVCMYVCMNVYLGGVRNIVDNGMYEVLSTFYRRDRTAISSCKVGERREYRSFGS